MIHTVVGVRRYARHRRCTMVGTVRTLHRRKKSGSDGHLGDSSPWKGSQLCPRLIGVCARIANGGKPSRRLGSATTRWVCAPKKTSSPSASGSRAPVGATTTLPGNRCAQQVRVPLLRPRSHNARRGSLGRWFADRGRMRGSGLPPGSSKECADGIPHAVPRWIMPLVWA
jgi:hypothetical protein